MSWVCPICSTSNDDINTHCFVCEHERRLKKLPLDELQRLFEKGSEAYSKGDFVTAFEYIERAAWYKYVPAVLLIAECYKLGNGTARDEVKMYEAYMLAAKKGDSKAQYELACCCYSGTGTKKNNSRVLTWIEKSAQQDYVSALKMLASFYVSGEIVARNCKKALSLYERILTHCDHCDDDVISGISRCKTEIAKEEFDDCMLAAKNGDAAEQYSLACRYYTGAGTKKNLSKAVSWLKKASDQQHVGAQKMLASLYLKGEGVVCDYDKAIELYEEAELNYEFKDESGCDVDPEICAGLGHCYTAKNKNITAARYYKKAAKAGYAEAQFLLAKCYEEGRGVFKSISKAKKWYSEAISNGYEEARIALRRL